MGKESGEKAKISGPREQCVLSREKLGFCHPFFSCVLSLMVPGYLPGEGTEELGCIFLLGMEEGTFWARAQ